MAKTASLKEELKKAEVLRADFNGVKTIAEQHKHDLARMDAQMKQAQTAHITSRERLMKENIEKQKEIERLHENNVIQPAEIRRLRERAGISQSWDFDDDEEDWLPHPDPPSSNVRQSDDVDMDRQNAGASVFTNSFGDNPTSMTSAPLGAATASQLRGPIAEAYTPSFTLPDWSQASVSHSTSASARPTSTSGDSVEFVTDTPNPRRPTQKRKRTDSEPTYSGLCDWKASTLHFFSNRQYFELLMAHHQGDKKATQRCYREEKHIWKVASKRWSSGQRFFMEWWTKKTTPPFVANDGKGPWTR